MNRGSFVFPDGYSRWHVCVLGLVENGCVVFFSRAREVKRWWDCVWDCGGFNGRVGERLGWMCREVSTGFGKGFGVSDVGKRPRVT